MQTSQQKNQITIETFYLFVFIYQVFMSQTMMIVLIHMWIDGKLNVQEEKWISDIPSRIVRYMKSTISNCFGFYCMKIEWFICVRTKQKKIICNYWLFYYLVHSYYIIHIYSMCIIHVIHSLWQWTTEYLTNPHVMIFSCQLCLPCCALMARNHTK